MWRALPAALLVACGAQHLSREQLLDPQTCGGCHPDHFKEWSGSMHAYAAKDPVFLAMNKKGQRVTNGALGAFCVNCHAPVAVREGATTDGLNLSSVPAKLQGVTCYFCHSVDAVQGTHDNPLHEASDFTMRGPLSDAASNSAHLNGYSTLHDRDQLASASLCGACHDVVTGHGAQLERTFSEWQGSVFSMSSGGTTCGQCHMPQSTGLQPIASGPGLSPRRRHAHSFAGVDLALDEFPEVEAQRSEVQALLDSTLQTGLCVTQGLPRIRVILDNVAAGHEFPSGASQDRRIWAEVTAYADGGVIYQSGAVADGASEVVAGDADQWLLRDCLFDEQGRQVHDFWEAASFEGNALPAQLTFLPSDSRFYQGHVLKQFPATGRLAVSPDRVTLRLRERPVSLDVIDALIASGDLDPGVRARIPTFELGKTLEWTADAGRVVATDMGQAVSCVSRTNLTLASTAVPAPARVRCAP